MAKPKSGPPKWVWVVGILVALVVIGGALNGGDPAKKDDAPAAAGAATTTAAAPVEAAAPPTAQAPAEQKPAKRVVVYEVTGAGTASSITYTTDGMTSTEQAGDAPLPWSKTIELPTGEAIQMVSIFAQAGAGTPEITAKITVDGVVVKEGKSSGQYAVVTVNENIGTLG
ncbi:MmpS family transport accessory protein [Actinosynnema sp. NPDC051121]|nr:hypothetical protein [Saccharothrix sp.]